MDLSEVESRIAVHHRPLLSIVGRCVNYRLVALPAAHGVSCFGATVGTTGCWIIPTGRLTMSTSDAVPGPCTSSTNEPSPSALPLPQPDPAQSIASESSGPKGKGEGKGKGRRREDESPDVKISKALSYILRHGAAKEGLKMRPDGYVRVDDIVRLPAASPSGFQHDLDLNLTCLPASSRGGYS